MKKTVIALISLLALWPVTAGAMSDSDIPSKFAIPWANGAGAPYVRSIPQASQIGVQNCAASLTDGFPPQTFVPASGGGCPPFGQDFNGILKQVTQWARWLAAGGIAPYDASFSSSIGGYPNGATLRNATLPSCTWVSTVDNNTSNPDTGGANWVASCPAGGIGGTSGGSANSQTITATPFVTQTGTEVTFIAGFTNTSSLSVTINGVGPTQVYRQWQGGKSLTVGGEVIATQAVKLTWDGTRWVCVSCEIAKVGTVLDYSGSSAPAGWLFIDGSCQAQSTYADLFSVVSTNYGSCSAGQFALPDGRGTVLAGQDNMGSNGAANRLTNAGSSCVGTTIGTICGAQNRTMVQANLPSLDLTVRTVTAKGSHSHSGSTTASNPSVGGGAFSPPSAGGNFGPGGITVNANTFAADPNFGLAATGGSSTPMVTVPPLQVVTKIIKL